MLKTKTYLLSALLSGLLLLGGMLAYVNMAPMNVLPYSYPMWTQAFERARLDSDSTARMLILGDSRAKAGVIPALVDEQCVALTIPGGSPIDFYLLLSEYLQHNPAPENMAVIISPHHFHYPDLFWSYTVGFGYLKSSEFDSILQLDIQGDNEFLGNSVAARARYFFQKNRFPHLYAGAIAGSLLEPRSQTNNEILNEARQANGHILFGTAGASDGRAYETDRRDFIVSDVEDSYFRKLLSLAEQHGITTEFVMAPINHASEEGITPIFREHFAGYINEIAADYPGMHFENSWPVYDDIMFGDANHLNQEGAAQFSRSMRVFLETNASQPMQTSALQHR